MRNYANYDPIAEGFDSIIAAQKGSKEGPKNPLYGGKASSPEAQAPGMMMDQPYDLRPQRSKLVDAMMMENQAVPFQTQPQGMYYGY